MGKTILISSHILSELRELCNKVGIIERGKLLFSGSVDEILAKVRSNDVALVQVREAPEQAAAALLEHDLITRAEVLADREGWIEVELAKGADDVSFVTRLLIERSFSVLSIREQEIDLEEAFMQVTKGQVA